MPTLWQTWALPAALLAIVNISATWYNVISGEVLEPYLDEFFHVPQAQKYCNGDYTWDPKITTPPGLYLIAKFFKPLLGCDIATLRALNVGALCLICPLCYGILRYLRLRPSRTHVDTDRRGASNKASLDADPSVAIDANSALSITLFPPLFFFSALFYTDVMSTLAVLLSYYVYLKKSTAAGTVFDNLAAVFIGIIALLFRQTNIFWVAVLPAGLSVIEALQASAKTTKSAKPADIVGLVGQSWDEGYIHDSTVDNATFGDYVFLVTSIAIASFRNLLLVVRVTLPYIALVLLFAGFVVWNGSVVLGDKTAHTATLHFPQMLYIWPYIAFFSAPVIVVPLLRLGLSYLPKQGHDSMRTRPSFPRPASFPSLLIAVLFFAFATAAVHFNTIIHPYTLADNRHYVFYVFSILRRHPAIRYLAVPVYYVSAWSTMQALVSWSNEQPGPDSKRTDRPTSNGAHRSPCQISFILIWLVTTALSVVTAPLVEPRYFILPWIIWRLHVPLNFASLSQTGKSFDQVATLCRFLEPAWLLGIDLVVTSIFIRWTFEWPNEPGKLQRFLW